jgi:hypothetical protein
MIISVQICMYTKIALIDIDTLVHWEYIIDSNEKVILILFYCFEKLRFNRLVLF